MQYLICLSDLLRAFQDQENIIDPVMFSWGEKLFCLYSYTHEDIREFESNNSYNLKKKKRRYLAENIIWQLKTKDLLSFGTVTPKHEHLGRDAFEI